MPPQEEDFFGEEESPAPEAEQNTEGSDEGQEPEKEKAAPDARWQGFIEDMKRERAEEQAAWKTEREEYKKQLAESRERAFKALFGDEIDPQDAKQRIQRDKIKKQLLETVPEIKDLIERGGGPRDDGEPTFAQKQFISTAQQQGRAMAKEALFEDELSQDVFLTLGDILILKTPEWKKRFYDDGDVSVLKTVHDFLTEKILKPRDRLVEQRLIAKIRKSGLPAIRQAPTGGGGGAPKAPKKKDVNINDPNQRNNLMLQIANRALAGGGEDEE